MTTLKFGGFWDWTGSISWNLVLNLFWQLSQKSLSSYLWQLVLMKIWGTFKTLLQFHFPSNIGKITLWWKDYDLTLNCVVLLPGFTASPGYYLSLFFSLSTENRHGFCSNHKLIIRGTFFGTPCMKTLCYNLTCEMCSFWTGRGR